MKIHLFTMLLLTSILLTGCSYSEAALQEKIWEQAGVRDDEDYQKYQEKLQNGEINADGYYPQPELQKEKPVHVTFWNDRLLDTHYYYDAQLSRPVNTEYCYMDHGESLYAATVNTTAGYENYTLSSFRIWDESSSQSKLYAENDLPEHGNLIFTIPKDKSITEYSVEPVGSYKKATLSFSSDHSGTWSVDGKEAENGVTVALPPGDDETLSVVYDYSELADSYYFSSSEPECYSNSEYQGKVYFQIDGKQDTDHHFSVKLAPYYFIKLRSDSGIDLEDAISSMSVNGVEMPITNNVIPRLKPGDSICFTMEKDYKITCNQVEFQREPLKNGCRFSFEIPEGDNTLDCRIQKWDTHEVKLDVPESPVWQQVIDTLKVLYKKDKSSENKANSILTVSTGTGDYTYQDLKSGKNLQIRECDDLRISVSESIKSQPNIQYVIQIGGQKPVSINGSTPDQERDITVSYKDLVKVGTVKINTEEGFLFSHSNFYTDEKLDIAYLVDGKEIADGTFLPVGTVVSVIVESCPDNYMIQEGGAVDPQTKEGTITISAKTSYDDFTINPVDNTALFHFDPRDHKVKNGTIEFSRNGRVISTAVKLYKGETLDYIVTPDTGYWIKDAEGQIVIDDEYSTKQALESIKVFKEKKITVNLMQPEYGGNIDYFIDGEQISFQNERSRAVTVMSGTEIRKEYKAWNGWSTNLEDKNAVFVAESDNSNAEPNIDDVFLEDTSYMPVLKVNYDKKVNSSITFELDADWQSGSNQTQNSKKRLLCNEKIRTGQNAFILHSKNGSLLNGTAIKVEITKKYQSSTKKSDETIIRYLDKLPLNEAFPIYVDNNRDALLTEISVIIQEVNVKSYTARRIPNATIELRYQDKAETPLLQNGQVIEANREVTVTITPDDGYQIYGADTNDTHTQYQKTMKYADYEKNIQKIINKHDINRICHITLPASDAYGTLTYQLDGTSVSGEIEYTEGQTLKITYELTDHDHRIIYQSNGITDVWGNFWGGALSPYKTSCNVTLGITHDGTILKREDHIQIT